MRQKRRYRTHIFTLIFFYGKYPPSEQSSGMVIEVNCPDALADTNEATMIPSLVDARDTVSGSSSPGKLGKRRCTGDSAASECAVLNVWSSFCCAVRAVISAIRLDFIVSICNCLAAFVRSEVVFKVDLKQKIM